MTVQPEGRYPAWTTGDRIRKARTIAGMTQDEFAAHIGTKEGTLAAWETDRSLPRNIVAVAKRIEALTGIPAAWTLDLDQGPPPLPPSGGFPASQPTDSQAAA